MSKLKGQSNEYAYFLRRVWIKFFILWFKYWLLKDPLKELPIQELGKSCLIPQSTGVCYSWNFSLATSSVFQSPVASSKTCAFESKAHLSLLMLNDCCSTMSTAHRKLRIKILYTQRKECCLICHKKCMKNSHWRPSFLRHVQGIPKLIPDLQAASHILVIKFRNEYTIYTNCNALHLLFSFVLKQSHSVCQASLELTVTQSDLEFVVILLPQPPMLGSQEYATTTSHFISLKSSTAMLRSQFFNSFNVVQNGNQKRFQICGILPIWFIKTSLSFSLVFSDF